MGKTMRTMAKIFDPLGLNKILMPKKLREKVGLAKGSAPDAPTVTPSWSPDYIANKPIGMKHGGTVKKMACDKSRYKSKF